MVTMRDVARAAGVSQASVSYAYSNSPRVSAAQREQIFAAALELGYTGPNIAGASLRLGRIGSVGVLVPGTLAAAVDDPSTALLLKGVVAVGELADVALTLLPVASGTSAMGDTVRPSTPAALRGLVDGLVLHCLPNDHPVVATVLARRIPAVSIDSPRVPEMPYVTVDHRGAGDAQMEHLLMLGHRRIGIITDRLSPRSSPVPRPLSGVGSIAETYLRERLQGYRDAAARHGVDTSAVPVVETPDIGMTGSAAAAAELFSTMQPTAVLATSDVHAVGAIKMIGALGFSVPSEVSVIGFDDAPVADLVGLTTVRQPLEDKGREAARILLDVIAGKPQPPVVLATELIVRSTTAAAPPARAGGAANRSGSTG